MGRLLRARALQSPSTGRGSPPTRLLGTLEGFRLLWVSRLLHRPGLIASDDDGHRLAAALYSILSLLINLFKGPVKLRGQVEFRLLLLAPLLLLSLEVGLLVMDLCPELVLVLGDRAIFETELDVDVLAVLGLARLVQALRHRDLL